ncbi:fibrohexamerin-like [Plutella xylostella]|uniref:fibrohexamerin-like n=1 Tax=Plutella xylostella TaxID=51655 RepID=UPI002032E981|nr:fibrohexamerin-like [Plutella xylostella]
MGKMEKVISYFSFVFFVIVSVDMKEQHQYIIIPGFDLKDTEREFAEQDADIYRPCPSYDLLCIRRYLSEHSKCKIANGPVPDPFFRIQSDNFYPTFNMSATQSEVLYGGLNGVVKEFYVNRKSALTILAVDFQNVTLNVREVIVRYHRRGQQAIVTNSTLDRERYASFRTTTVFNGFAELELENSETTAYVDSPPAVIVGPELGVHPDPTIALRFAAFIANLPVITQENFLTSAPFYASTYIQYVLCDFGLMIK